ncbi:type II toxin-antitoxin system RelE/ParE family toxin [Fuerstiella marisgermanici]|uniref:Putative addiction module killer protein n=1 Tax=Fuerstiella marisgermanici TaxID=1891926 RepID=A0A1P8WP97_9PLAN|nr:type II toxin-antitoxin system RelE/ParE family toxin [Fuerstiella marisgermanici]APZ95882.1 putative addiction module killer protein [Fuerstiella marisgermanici]
MVEVKQYETKSGLSPFAEWFDLLNDDVTPRLVAAIRRMELGNFGDVKPVGGGVSERRLDFGPGYRIYFGRDGADLVILLVGGTKKRQQRDIETAQDYWADYKQRKREAAKAAKPKDEEQKPKKKKKKPKRGK